MWPKQGVAIVPFTPVRKLILIASTHEVPMSSTPVLNASPQSSPVLPHRLDGKAALAPSAAPAAKPRRGRPSAGKTRITIYLDDEVLEQFRQLANECGKGYQTLINATLRARLQAEPGR
jgi:uncharacterized protein (DUF4415 family)